MSPHVLLQFAKAVFFQVTEVTLTAEPPKYQAILDLDKKLRDIPVCVMLIQVQTPNIYNL